MKRMLFILAAFAVLASFNQAEARWFRRRPYVRVEHRHYRPYARPRRVYYVEEPVYYEPYYEVIEEYIDDRDPGIAMAQDGFNMMFDAISRSSRRSHRRCRR